MGADDEGIDLRCRGLKPLDFANCDGEICFMWK